MSRACVFLAASLLFGHVLLGSIGEASAHPLAPSVLTLEQAEEGAVTMRWRAPASSISCSA